MPPLSIGKLRGLQQCATARGALAILALDHRQNLRQALNRDAPQTVADVELTAFKQEAIAALGPAATGVLLDPEYGAAQCIASGALPGGAGLLVAVEASGYGGDSTARHSRLLPGWSAAKVRRMGASAVKLLVYYHPESATAPQIESLVRQMAGDCALADLPLFLEPLGYSLDAGRSKLSPDERRRVVIESAKRLVTASVDVLKAEFPLDITAHPDEREWAAACEELSQASPAPWVLLSGTTDYDTYLRQVAVACRAGASGVAVGRAVWKEATGLGGEARAHFLRVTARERMARLTSLCEALARPWAAFYQAPHVGPDWYAQYGERL